MSKKYYCKNCDKYYSRQDSLARHLKKNNCIYACKLCDSAYKSRSGLYKHKKTYHPETIKSKGNKNNILNNKNKNGLIGNNNSNNNINSNNISYNILIVPKEKINLVDFGKEDVNIFTKKEINKMLSNKDDFLQKLILFVNFNKKYPQFYNCYYPNENKNAVFVVINGGWRQITLDIASNDMIIFRLRNYDDFVKKIKLSNEEKEKNDIKIYGINKNKTSYNKSYIKKILISHKQIIKDTYELTKNYIPEYDFLNVSDESSSDEENSELSIEEEYDESSE